MLYESKTASENPAATHDRACQRYAYAALLGTRSIEDLVTKAPTWDLRRQARAACSAARVIEPGTLK